MNDTLILDSNSFLRFGGDYRELIERLPSLGPVLVQARNHGGGLAKTVSEVSPILVDGYSFAFDPDCGFGFSLDELIAIHATAKRLEVPFDTDSLDFEFACFPAGASLLEISGFSTAGAVDRFARNFGGLAVTPDAMHEWRREIAPPLPLCRKCMEAAERRGKNPEIHPLYSILDYLRHCATPIDCRIMGEHVDLTAEMVPACLQGLDGYLLVHDLDGHVVMHIHLRFLKAFRIDRTTLEGQERATLQMFGMQGEQTFEISCDIPEMVELWRALCGSNQSLYPWGDGC